MEAPIFEFGKLDDFQKLIYSQHHVKCLQKIIEVKNRQLDGYREAFDQLVYENLDSTKLTNVKKQLAIQEQMTKKYKELWQELKESKSAK